MSKLVLDDIGGGYNRSKFNENFEKIEEEFQDKVLYRDNPDGEPNQMENDLDMNSHKLLNVADGLQRTDGVNLGQMQDILYAVDVEGGSIISCEMPPTSVTATRWWHSETGKAYILTENSTGHKQWVEERSPIDPPDYEIEIYRSADSLISINADYHKKMLIVSAETAIITLEQIEFLGDISPAIVFIRFDGTGSCTFAAGEGVTLLSATTTTFSKQYSMATAMCTGDNEWVVAGDLEVA